MFNSITNAQDGFHRHHNAKPLVMRSTRISISTKFHYKKHLTSAAPHFSLFGRRTKCRRSRLLSFMPIRTPVWLMIQFYINSPIGELTSILTMPFFICTLFAYQIAYSQVSHIYIFFSTVCVIKWTNIGAIYRQRQLIPLLHPKSRYLTKLSLLTKLQGLATRPRKCREPYWPFDLRVCLSTGQYSCLRLLAMACLSILPLLRITGGSLAQGRH